jgi:hypothetical protein
LTIGLLHFRQHLGDPAPTVERTRGKRAVRVVIEVQADPQLPQVILALQTSRRLSGPLHGWKQEGDDHGQHADRHGQVDQGESVGSPSAASLI